MNHSGKLTSRKFYDSNTIVGLNNASIEMEIKSEGENMKYLKMIDDIKDEYAK